MKSIELTEEHIFKLLEMCKVLFTKEIHGLTIQDNGFLNYSDTSKTVDYDDRIHWFEFCMTHLIVKLSKEFTKQGLSKADYTNNQYPNWFSEKLSYHLNPFRNEEFEEDIEFIHPIDYLYEEFKKLK